MAVVQDISWHWKGFYTIHTIWGKGQGQGPPARFSTGSFDFCLKKQQNQAGFPNFYQKGVI